MKLEDAYPVVVTATWPPIILPSLRGFGLVDPNGMWVDVVQQIEPQPGFWEPYTR